VLSAINPGDLSSRFELGFSEVHYIRMLHSWVGNIEERSISERDEILKTDAEESVKLIRQAESGLKLYKANQDKIIIIGYLLHIGPWESI
jgi:hypothetical protein